MSDNDLSTRPDGGPAHPVPMGSQNNQYACAVGLSLRDWFAGQAISGAMTNGDDLEHADWDGCAAYAYQLADAMLKARNPVVVDISCKHDFANGMLLPQGGAQATCTKCGLVSKLDR